MSSPPSNGLMKPKPRGFQRQASPFLRAPASPPPPPPPRPRLRLREPPPPRERLRERLCLEGLSAPLVANYWDKCSGASRKHGICSLGRRITFAICSSASSINNSPAFNTSHHSTIIHDYTSHHFNHHSRLHHIISTIIHDFKSRQRRLRAQRIDTSPSQWGLMCVLDVQRPGLLTGAGAGPLGRSAP